MKGKAREMGNDGRRSEGESERWARSKEGMRSERERDRDGHWGRRAGEVRGREEGMDKEERREEIVTVNG